MAKIIAFPTKAVRDWQIIEKALRKVLDGTAADQPAKDTIVERMKPVYELCNRSFSFSVDFPLTGSVSVQERQAVVDAVERSIQQYELGVQQLIDEILLERLSMEIQRYYEAYDSDDSNPAG